MDDKHPGLKLAIAQSIEYSIGAVYYCFKEGILY